jgi:hypothetical protein
VTGPGERPGPGAVSGELPRVLPGECPGARRTRRVPGGPLLVDGPVTVRLADGREVTSDRVVVAVCLCGRSARYPWCDTSHRSVRGTA